MTGNKEDETKCPICNGIGFVHESHNDKYGYGIEMKLCNREKEKEAKKS